MLIVKSVAVPYGNDVIKFASDRAKAPHISVLIGPNGSRKSLILRNIVLSGAELRPRAEDFIGEIEFSTSPTKVIAISAAPTDRFPPHRAYGETTVGRKDDESIYSYIGPRTSQNLISRSHSARLLTYEVLTKMEQLGDPCRTEETCSQGRPGKRSRFQVA